MPHLLPTVTEAGWGGPRVSVVRTHMVPTQEEAANKISWNPRSWEDPKAFAGENTVLTAGCRQSLHSGQGTGRQLWQLCLSLDGQGHPYPASDGHRAAMETSGKSQMCAPGKEFSGPGGTWK